MLPSLYLCNKKQRDRKRSLYILPGTSPDDQLKIDNFNSYFGFLSCYVGAYSFARELGILSKTFRLDLLWSTTAISCFGKVALIQFRSHGLIKKAKRIE